MAIIALTAGTFSHFDLSHTMIYACSPLARRRHDFHFSLMLPLAKITSEARSWPRRCRAAFSSFSRATARPAGRCKSIADAATARDRRVLASLMPVRRP